MRTISKLGFTTPIALVIWACGGSTSTSGSATNIAASDLATYEQLTMSAQTAATNYRANMMQSDLTAATCKDIHDGYDGNVRPVVSRMMQMAGEMDNAMGEHGGTSSADVACVAAAMMAELDHHRAVACTFSDVASDESEAERHVGAMLSFGGHMSDRCGEIERGMDGGVWSWGSMMGGCQDFDADGGMPHDWNDGDMPYHGDDGGTMHEGGMMGGH